MQRIIGFILLLGAGIGAYFCVTNVLWQDRAIRHFVAVPAQILNAEVRAHRGSKGGMTYSPEATYTYSYEGRPYQKSRVLAISYSSSSRAWAQDVLARIDRAGAPGIEKGTWRSTAYVDPQNPEDAILVRDYSFMPYGFGMGTLLAAAIGLGLLVGVIGGGRTKMNAVALDDSGWQLLLPQTQMRTQYRSALLWLIGGGVAVTLLPLHWLLVAGQTGLAALISGGLALGLMAALTIMVYRRWSVCRHLSDARLRIKPAPAPRGEAFALEVGIDAYSPLRVTNFSVRVLCIEHYKESRGNKTVYGTRTRSEQLASLCGPTETPAGAELTGQAQITLDRSLPPTTDLTVKMHPYYTWEIRLALELTGMVDYAAVFPLEVD